MEKGSLKNSRPRPIHNILFFSLLLSQNTSLIHFYGLFQNLQVPNFALLFLMFAFILSLASLISQYHHPKPESAFLVQFWQNLGLVFSKIILLTVINLENRMTSNSFVCLVLFLAQSLLVATKIVYFGSVLPEQIAQNSALLKLLRLLKIVFFAILPIFLHSPAAFLIIFGIFQLSQALVFCLKFTYQQIDMEYIVMIGIIGGVVSALEGMIQLMADTPHFFLSQCLMLALFFLPSFSLLRLLEIKYFRLLCFQNLKGEPQNLLIMFRFMRQGLFQQERTVQLSQQAQGKCWLFFPEIVKLKKGKIINSADNKNEKSLWSQLIDDRKLLQKQYFEVLCHNINQKAHFQNFAFKIECALKMQEKYIKYSLIMYYEYVQSVKDHKNSLETCKIQRIYSQITRKIYEKKSDFAPTHFISFDKLLQNLRGKLKTCIDFEMNLIKYVSKQKRNTLQSDDMLAKRSEYKEDVHNSILTLLKNNLYVDSNQFKYLFLLFHLSILKEPQLMVSLIKNYFSCKEANQKLVDSTFQYFIILDGSNNGQILNCNQNFKNKFKLNSQLIYNNKGTINKLFPTVLQAKTHIIKMNQAQMQVAQTSQIHCDFSCLIVVEKQFNGFKFNSLQPFTISTRIFFQNKSGFNYICQFFPLSNHEEGKVTLEKNQCQKLQKLVSSKYKHQHFRKVVQLEEEIQLVDIYVEQLNEQITIKEELQIQDVGCVLENDRNRNGKNLTSLEEKLDMIEKKIIETKQGYGFKWSKTRLLELCICCAIIIVVTSVFFSIQNKIAVLEHANSQKQIVKDSCLKRNKMMLSKLIMKLLDSNIYPSNLCNYYFRDFHTYLRNDITQDFKYGFDDLLNLITNQDKSDSTTSSLYSQSNYFQTYLDHFTGNISFIKSIHLLKSSFSQWLQSESQQVNQTFDVSYYTQKFPKILQSYSFAGKNSPYPLINAQTDKLSQQLTSGVIILRSVVCILCGSLIFIAIILRLLDTQQILDYMSILQNSPYGFLRQRQKELAYTRNLLQKLRYSYIYEIQIQEDNFNVRSNEKLLETINDQAIFRKNVEPDQKKSDLKIAQCEEQELCFLGNKNKVVYADITTSSRIKNIAIYNKNYLVTALLLLLATTFSIPKCFDLYFQNLKRIESNDKVTAKLSEIQQKYINLVAYNWLKTTSIAKSLNITNLQQLFNDTITYLQRADYQNTVIKYYPRQIANQRLYEDSCKYLSNPQECNKYRNGVFNSGSSVLLPLTINQELQSEQFQTNFMNNLPNLCDKTYLLYKIVVQFQKNLPIAASQFSQNNLHPIKQLSIYFCIGLLVVLTLVYQFSVSEREHIVLKQLLSLDYVQKLYEINEFKPLFNRIFYK